MIDLKSFLLGAGLILIIVPLVQGIVNFILEILELVSSYFRNKQTLHASKVQAQIDGLVSPEESVNAIGFQAPTQYDDCEEDYNE